MSKIHPSLSQRLQAMTVDRADHEIPVIVTVSSDADMAAMESRGLKVQRTLESVSAVAGTLAADRVKDLAALEEVRAIEYDGEIRAL